MLHEEMMLDLTLDPDACPYLKLLGLQVSVLFLLVLKYQVHILQVLLQGPNTPAISCSPASASPPYPPSDTSPSGVGTADGWKEAPSASLAPVILLLPPLPPYPIKPTGPQVSEGDRDKSPIHL